MRRVLAFLIGHVAIVAAAGTITVSGDSSTWVDSTAPDGNFFYNGVFAVDTVRTGLIKFLANATLCTSNIIHAELRLIPISSSDGLQTVRRMTPVSWSASDVTWTTRPVAQAEIVGMFGPVSTGPNPDATPITLDITSAYLANKCDPLTLAITGTNDVRLFISSAGNGFVNSPSIVVEYGPADPVAPAMTMMQIVGYCLTAFGLGYAGGAIQRIVRQAIEVID